MKTFAICNLGCKVNNYEANWYIEQLSTKYQLVDFDEFADIYVINSCSVTNMAGAKTRQMIHKARKQNPACCLVAVSCYVQLESNNKEIFADCDILIGSKDKIKLPQLIDDYLTNKQRIDIVQEFVTTTFEKMYIADFKQTRAYIKIQDGCNQFCSYCVIPYARARERCLPYKDVIEQAKQLVASNHQEIVLTGIHTGRWNDNGLDLADLMQGMLNEVEGLKRIRLSSIEMTEVTDKLICLMQSDERIARHLHIPLQVGNDRLLNLNNRPYTTQQYYQRVMKIKEQIPGISISSDVIAGLPTESEQEAKQGLEFIEKCQLSFLHVFPYARKERTKAAILSPQVKEGDKKERAACLTNLSSRLYNRYVGTLLDKDLDVLFETGKDGFLRGHCSQYVLVQVASDKDLTKQMCSVHIDAISDNYLIGHLN